MLHVINIVPFFFWEGAKSRIEVNKNNNFEPNENEKDSL